MTDIVKTGYDDWVELLEHTGNTDMLKDPYAVWLEAFHVATMLERHGTLHALRTQVHIYADESVDENLPMGLTVGETKQLQLNLLKQVLKVVESKGLARQAMEP